MNTYRLINEFTESFVHLSMIMYVHVQFCLGTNFQNCIPLNYFDEIKRAFCGENNSIVFTSSLQSHHDILDDFNQSIVNGSPYSVQFIHAVSVERNKDKKNSVLVDNGHVGGQANKHTIQYPSAAWWGEQTTGCSFN